MRKVRWTMEEREDLAKRAANIIRKQGVTMAKALKRAQEAGLPEERRRKLGALDKAMRLGIHKYLNELKQEQPAVVKTEVIREVLVHPLTIRDLPMEDLVNEVFRRTLFSAGFDQKLHGMIVAPIVQAIRQELPTLAKILLSARKASKETKPKEAVLPRVFVIGLLPEQAHEIEKAFDGVVKLSFSADGRIDHLRPLAANADRTILMQKFSSHSIQDVAKSVAGKHFMVCNGATSNLKALLEHLYLQGDLT